MKIAINKCYGGFSLSPKAISRLAELQGKQCFFFKHGSDLNTLVPTTIEEIGSSLFFTAYSVPNPKEVAGDTSKWCEMSHEERGESNKRWSDISLDSRPDGRTDKNLIQVIEELGEAASGQCSKIGIVEIPDGVEWEISEYDGIERVEEKHRSWS